MTRRRIVFTPLVSTVLALVGCLYPAPQQRRSSARTTHWNPAPGFCCSNGWSPAGDVNGEVGHPLQINGPGAHCWGAGNGAPDTRTRLWGADMRITSGALPPGLSMDWHGEISGIPTERGHYIVHLQVMNATCDHVTFPNMTTWGSDIRFHITGSGQVIR